MRIEEIMQMRFKSRIKLYQKINIERGMSLLFKRWIRQPLYVDFEICQLYVHH